jgi:hypothetical protein
MGGDGLHTTTVADKVQFIPHNIYSNSWNWTVSLVYMGNEEEEKF